MQTKTVQQPLVERMRTKGSRKKGSTFHVYLSRSLMPLPQSSDLSCGLSVMLKSPLMIHSQSFGKASIIMCHKCCLSVGILGAYMHAIPIFPPFIPSNLIHTIRSS